MNDADRTRMLEDLYRRYAAAVYDKCRWMLADSQMAEDAVQETFLKAYALLHRVADREPQAFLPWLYRITNNVCLHALRTRRRKGLLLTGAPLDERAAGHPRADRTAFARQALARLVQTLDLRSLEIVVAVYLDGMTQSEVAESMGISRRAVTKRLTAMRARIAPILAEEP